MDHPLGWKTLPWVIALHRVEWPKAPLARHPGSVVTPILALKLNRYWCFKFKERFS
jgi:hypothetical protein